MDISKNSTDDLCSAGQADASLLPFKKFQLDVEHEFSRWASQTNGSDAQRNKLLNGGANVAAFTLINEPFRKEFGIFFSGHTLANLVASKIAPSLASGASVIDPACGAGDLLIACARHYPKQQDYQSTLSFWKTRLGGIDLHETFTSTVKSRLKLLATESHLPDQFNLLSPDFQNLVVGDALTQMELIKEFGAIVTNPPYGSIDAPSDITWSKGKLQIAAVFMDCIVKNAKPGQEIVAVLPDVLRSGTRYSKWRSWIASKAEILSIDIVGKFDKTTDVDVFVIHLRVNEHQNRKWPVADLPQTHKSDVTIESLFNVRVGPVVPHRDLEDGPLRMYIDCSDTPDKAEVIPTQERKFNSTPYKGPFVVIHRTSSPDDTNRLVASIVKTSNLVMVENHLIIIQPIDGMLKTCRKLLTKLKDNSVKEWINQRIRCRHLTVTAIKDIPINWSE